MIIGIVLTGLCDVAAICSLFFLSSERCVRLRVWWWWWFHPLQFIVPSYATGQGGQWGLCVWGGAGGQVAVVLERCA